MNDFRIALQLEVDKNSKKTVNEQLVDLQKTLEPLGIKLDIDTKTNKQIEGLLKQVKTLESALAKLSTKKLVNENALEQQKKYYSNVSDYMTKYKLGLMDLFSYEEKLRSLITTPNGNVFKTFSELDGKKQKEILKEIANAQKQISDAYNTNQQIDATRKLTAEQNKLNQELQYGSANFSKLASVMDGRQYEEFANKAKEATKAQKELISYEANFGKDKKGNSTGRLDSVLLTYRDNIGQIIKETMAWADVTDESGKVVAKQWQNIATKIIYSKEQLEKLKLTQKEDSEKMMRSIGRTDTKYSNGVNDEESANIKKLVTAYASLNLETAQGAVLAKRVREELALYIQQTRTAHKETNKFTKEQEQLNFTIKEFKKMQGSRLDTLLVKGADIAQVEKLKNELKQLDPTTAKAKQRMVEIRNEITLLGKTVQHTGLSFKDFIGMAIGVNSVYEVFQLGKRAISSMVEGVFTLDHALTELRKTSDLSGESLNKFIDNSYQIGEKLGRVGSDVVNASSEFSKAGFGDKEIANLSEVALLMTNVGDGIKDVSEASGTMISAMKGFRIESQNAVDIVDKINAVSNSSASNFEDISFGLERMSGTLGLAGTTLDETIASFSAVNDILRNSEMVSSGLNSVFSRMRGLSEQTGESVDGLVPKLQSLYESFGVAFTDSDGQLRDTFDVLSDLSKVWQGLTVNQKQYLASESAG